MSDEHTSIVTSIAIPGEEMPDLEEPIVISAEEVPVALEIRAALISTSTLGGATLHIATKDNNVTISGRVRSERQHELALSIAGRYVGRDRVIDRIDVEMDTSYFCEA